MKSPTVTVAGRVTIETRQLLEQRAKVEDVTVSQLIARLLSTAQNRWAKAKKVNA